MILIPKRKFTGTPATHNLTMQETLNQVRGLNLDWANIKNAAITDAQITSCSITKLTVGNLAVVATLTTGKLATGAADTNRIEIDANYVAGYNAANVLQFYLSAADGKAYAGAGAVILDALGLTLNGAISTAALRFIYGSDQSVIYAGAGAALSVSAKGALILSSEAAEIRMGTSITAAAGDSFDIGVSGTKFRNVYAQVFRPTSSTSGGIILGTTAIVEEGSLKYAWNGTVLTILVYASGSWRMNPAP